MGAKKRVQEPAPEAASEAVSEGEAVTPQAADETPAQGDSVAGAGAPDEGSSDPEPEPEPEAPKGDFQVIAKGYTLSCLAGLKTTGQYLNLVDLNRNKGAAQKAAENLIAKKKIKKCE